ncbi:MAG: Ku protein [Bacteriovoracia bacterium]
MSFWKGAINFGLIHIPVGLETAKEDEPLHFRMLDSNDNSPVGYQHYNKNTGKVVDRKQIVRGYEYEKNKYVIVDNKDFAKAKPGKEQIINLEDFVSLEELSPLFYQRPYYIIPGKGADKSYHLLRIALEKQNKAGIGQIVMRSKAHLAAVIAQGNYLILELLSYSHRLLETQEAGFLQKSPETIKIQDKEIEMAETLIESMTDHWEPRKYQDEYYDNLKNIIKQKISQGEVTAPPAPEQVETEDTTNISDLMPLLKRSLEKTKGKKEETKTKKPKKRKRAS